MADSAVIKTIYSPMNNVVELVENEYSFAIDGGAVSDIDLIKFGENMVGVSAWLECTETCTSGGSATVAIQVGGTAIQTPIAVGSLVSGAVFPLALTEGTPNVSLVPAKFATTTDLGIEINTAALTAGKLKVKVLVAKLG